MSAIFTALRATDQRNCRVRPPQWAAPFIVRTKMRWPVPQAIRRSPMKPPPRRLFYSQNNSRVIGFPLNRFRIASRRGRLGYTQRCFVALCADPDVAAGRVFDRRQRLGADSARRHLLSVDTCEPFAPV